jgi:hypothetical protein
VKLDVVQNAGERVENSVDNVQETLIEGALLTVLVVFLFLNSWRSTVITGLALPVSVLASFTAVWAFGFTLNTMSLLGLSLAIGILIDDAIVVRETSCATWRWVRTTTRRRARGPTRSGLAGGGDDVLHRLRLRTHRLHGEPGGAVVRAVRADHRVLGAGFALRVVLAGPDALRLLARTRTSPRTRSGGSRGRWTASTAGSTTRRTATAA